QGQTAIGLMSIFQMAMLALPALGMVLTTARVGRRFGGAAWRWSAPSAARRTGLVLASAALAGATAFLRRPNGEYRPIQPADHGTIVGAIESIEQIPTGRASLTIERQRQLGGAPTERQRERVKAHDVPSSQGQRPHG